MRYYEGYYYYLDQDDKLKRVSYDGMEKNIVIDEPVSQYAIGDGGIVFTKEGSEDVMLVREDGTRERIAEETGVGLSSLKNDKLIYITYTATGATPGAGYTGDWEEEVVVYDLRAGEEKRIKLPPDIDWYGALDGIVGGYYWFWADQQSGLSLFRLDTGSGKLERIAENISWTAYDAEEQIYVYRNRAESEVVMLDLNNPEEKLTVAVPLFRVTHYQSKLYGFAYDPNTAIGTFYVYDLAAGRAEKIIEMQDDGFRFEE
jgi:hypothetical protein